MKQTICIATLCGMLLSLMSPDSMAAQPASEALNWLLDSAVEHDLSLQQSRQSEQALNSQQAAVSRLPDPRVSPECAQRPD